MAARRSDCKLPAVGVGERINALVLGAISRDRLARPGSASIEQPGGVVHHAGITLARLGARTRVVTRVKTEDAAELLADLREKGVELQALPSAATTRYLNDYGASPARHILESASDPIAGEDLSEGWRAADLIQLGPLHSRDLLPSVAEITTGFKGIDVQGFFRERGDGGRRTLERFLPHVQVLQTSEDDLDGLLQGETLAGFRDRSKLRELIVTRSRRGATVLSDEGEEEISARVQIAGAVDPERLVGLGDTFLATYLFERVSGAGPRAAAERAAAGCTSKIEGGA